MEESKAEVTPLKRKKREVKKQEESKGNVFESIKATNNQIPKLKLIFKTERIDKRKIESEKKKRSPIEVAQIKKREEKI